MAVATSFEFKRHGSFISVRPAASISNAGLTQQQRETEFLFDRDEISRLREIADDEGGWAKL